MAIMKDIEGEFGGLICRRCINMLYNARLSRDDCRYDRKMECPSCGETRHLVSGFTLSGRSKMRGLTFTPPQREEETHYEEAPAVDKEREEMNDLKARLRKREQQVDALYRELDDMTEKYRQLAVIMRDSANAILEVTEGVADKPKRKLSVL